MDSSCTVYGCWFESWMIEVFRDPPSLFPMPMMQDPVVGDPITATAAPREPGKTAGQRSATPIRAAHRAAQGSQLACLAFTARLQAADVRISMGENGPRPRWCRVNRSNQGRPHGYRRHQTALAARSTTRSYCQRAMSQAQGLWSQSPARSRGAPGRSIPARSSAARRVPGFDCRTGAWF